MSPAQSCNIPILKICHPPNPATSQSLRYVTHPILQHPNHLLFFLFLIIQKPFPTKPYPSAPASSFRRGSGLAEAKELILLRVGPLTGRTHQRTDESLSGFRMFLVKEQLGRIAEKLSIARDQSDQSWEKVFLWPGLNVGPALPKVVWFFFLNPKLAIAGMLMYFVLSTLYYVFFSNTSRIHVNISVFHLLGHSRHGVLADVLAQMGKVWRIFWNFRAAKKSW